MDAMTQAGDTQRAPGTAPDAGNPVPAGDPMARTGVNEPAGESSTDVVRTQRPSLEADGYNADTVRQGRLLFRANRFAEAIDVLAGMPDDPEAKYWTARCYEALGNEHEAVVRYRQLTEETGGAEYIARRAEHDLSFLEWKQRFNDQKEQ